MQSDQAMKIDQVRAKTSRSSEKLELAQQLAREAETLPEGDDKRKWLEERAQKLIDEARALTEIAKHEITKYR
jgi:hypothetical protein